MIAIIDYEMGNLPNVKRGIEKFTNDVVITSDPKVIQKADKVILPGVGAFGDAMRNIDKLNLRDVIVEAAASKPTLGVCLGLQLLFDKSEEDMSVDGLGIIKGRVLKFDSSLGLKIPEMGWNSVRKTKNSNILAEIENNSYFYFVHSYYVAPEDKDVIAGVTNYGVEFASVIEKGNVMAAQFHPEKSHDWGLKILKSFVEL